MIRCCVGTLCQMGPLQVSEVSGERAGRNEMAAALSQFHYLGFGGTVGENLQYMVRSVSGRLLACLVFGSAAWKCQDRDRFIGWTVAQRTSPSAGHDQQHPFPGDALGAGAASGQLGVGCGLATIVPDWQTKYGHPIHLVETFVQQDRFRATAYRAANWIRVGQTTGRTRQDRFYSLQTPIKDVYVYPLQRNFRQHLCP